MPYVSVNTATSAASAAIAVNPITRDGGTVEEMQLMNVADPTTGNSGRVTAAGQQRVFNEPASLFMDTFDNGLDTAIRYNTPVSGGGGVAATATGGVLNLASGTTANGYSYLQSQFAFPLNYPGYVQSSFAVTIEFPVLLNAYRFWGQGTSATTPTATAPLVNATGFELYTDGKLYAVQYGGGFRAIIADLSVATGNKTQPADANTHQYYIYNRGDLVYYAIDNFDNVVATAGVATGPAVNTLPIKLQAIAGATAPTSSASINCGLIAVGDTAHNSNSISDGTYGWRKAIVSSTGGLYTNSVIQTGAQSSTTSGFGASLQPAATADNKLRVAQQPTTLLYEAFDSAIDYINVWTLLAGSVTPTQVSSNASISPRTTASAYSVITSQAMFYQQSQTYNSGAFIVTIDAATTSNNYRFFGYGTVPTTPTTTAPLADAVGFELNTDGTMNAVVWQNGTNVYRQALTRPSDGLIHRYVVDQKAPRNVFYIDDTTIPVAIASNVQTNKQTMPLCLLNVNASTAPTTAPTYQFGGVSSGDQGRNNIGISDGTYPWRKAKISPNGNLATYGGPAAANTTGNLTAAGTATAISVAVPYAGNITVQISGTYVAAFTFQASVDGGTTWVNITGARADNSDQDSVTPTLTNVSQIWNFAAAGISNFRVYASTYTSGTAAVVISQGSHLFAPTVVATITPSVTRQRVILSANAIVTVTSETLLSHTNNVGGVLTTAQTSFTVPAGYTFRIQTIYTTSRVTTFSTTGTACDITFRIRLNSLTGPLEIQKTIRSVANVPTVIDHVNIAEGIEYPAGTVIVMTQQASATTGTGDYIIKGYIY